MKLRIQGDSLRLRLTQKEVAQLREGGSIESRIHFASGSGLAYVLSSSVEATEVAADFDAGVIRVVLPYSAMAQWADGNQVSIAGGGSGQPSLVLIEKDFQCLHKPGEQDPDAYPNPLAEVSNSSR